jgi:hypothetical protein
MLYFSREKNYNYLWQISTTNYVSNVGVHTRRFCRARPHPPRGRTPPAAPQPPPALLPSSPSSCRPPSIFSFDGRIPNAPFHPRGSPTLESRAPSGSAMRFSRGRTTPVSTGRCRSPRPSGKPLPAPRRAPSRPSRAPRPRSPAVAAPRRRPPPLPPRRSPRARC